MTALSRPEMSVFLASHGFIVTGSMTDFALHAQRVAFEAFAASESDTPGGQWISFAWARIYKQVKGSRYGLSRETARAVSTRLVPHLVNTGRTTA